MLSRETLEMYRRMTNAERMAITMQHVENRLEAVLTESGQS
jgi:hypothetical protein